MRYMDYKEFDVLNGIGFRNTLFVSGCVHACKGCHNILSWSKHAGQEYTKDFEDYILKTTSNDSIRGLTLSGGDPLHEVNTEPIINLCKRVKSELPNKDIWLWTGYTIEELKDDDSRKDILNHIDVLVDGKYKKELRTTTLPWRGSSNQNIYYMTDNKLKKKRTINNGTSKISKRDT